MSTGVGAGRQATVLVFVLVLETIVHGPNRTLDRRIEDEDEDEEEARNGAARERAVGGEGAA